MWDSLKSRQQYRVATLANGVCFWLPRQRHCALHHFSSTPQRTIDSSTTPCAYCPTTCATLSCMVCTLTVTLVASRLLVSRSNCAARKEPSPLTRARSECDSSTMTSATPTRRGDSTPGHCTPSLYCQSLPSTFSPPPSPSSSCQDLAL